MTHYGTTKNMTGKELSNYLRGNLRVGDTVQYQNLPCEVIAKNDDGYFWLKNCWVRPVTAHCSDIDILEGM